MPEHPFPDLNLQEGGLSFPWAELHPRVVGEFDASLGADGVALSMLMIIRWEDLKTALQELLGFSYRNGFWPPTEGEEATLMRKLPWRHPLFNQLWVKRISKVQGIRMEGKRIQVILGTAGDWASWTGSAPVTWFRFALLTIHFWRPPYYVRSDNDIKDENGNPIEWLRYVDKNWETSTELLVRENSFFAFCPGQSTDLTNQYFQGSIGQKLVHHRVKRKWYQIPEAAIFKPIQVVLANGVTDVTPNGIPFNLSYTQTETINPITGYIYPAESPIAGCVNSPRGGGVDDEDETLRFFGCQMGTLMLMGVTFEPQPLQLPPELMFIPFFGQNQPISQVQYDITFHFDLFDPPRSPYVTNREEQVNIGTVAAPNLLANSKVKNSFRGHNLNPWAGDGFFYAVRSIIGPPSAGNEPLTTKATPFMYADFFDLFRIL